MDLLGRPIFLFTFPPVPHVYSISPFALKLESYFRINSIPYTPVYDASRFSSKRQMPYIRLDDPHQGPEIADSNQILAAYIQQEGEPSSHSESRLSAADRAVSHAFIRMLEEHTTQINFYYRYGLHISALIDALDLEHRFPPQSAEMFRKFQPPATLEKTKMRGLSRHSDDELWEFSNDDIQALSDFLGTKRYMLGDEPSLLDCAVFGHLSQFLWIPLDFPQKQFMKQKCPNVVELLDRFREEYWPDWKELCATQLDHDVPN